MRRCCSAPSLKVGDSHLIVHAHFIGQRVRTRYLLASVRTDEAMRFIEGSIQMARGAEWPDGMVRALGGLRAPVPWDLSRHSEARTVIENFEKYPLAWLLAYQTALGAAGVIGAHEARKRILRTALLQFGSAVDNSTLTAMVCYPMSDVMIQFA